MTKDSAEQLKTISIRLNILAQKLDDTSALTTLLVADELQKLSHELIQLYKRNGGQPTGRSIEVGSDG